LRATFGSGAHARVAAGLDQLGAGALGLDAASATQAGAEVTGGGSNGG
jgi:hypothetical protein